MRTTLSLDDDVYEAAKTLSQGSGESLGRVVSQLARRGLQPAEVVTPSERDGLPTFAVSPEAAVIPGSRAAELLAAEGTE
jgi:hypothetical protein